MSRDHFWREFKANCQSDPIRSEQSDPGFVNGPQTLNAKYSKFYGRIVKSTRNGELCWLSGRFHTLILRSRDTVQTLESPGLSTRVDSTDVSVKLLIFNKSSFPDPTVPYKYIHTVIFEGRSILFFWTGLTLRSGNPITPRGYVG